MFKKILVANRGEVAVRIIRACKELGIQTAIIYSSADIKTLAVKLADEAYLIGEPQSSLSYLNKEKIIQLCRKINADAVHPGYGFLSENAEFIRMLEDKGITFIGPSSKSVEMMGSKTAARLLMQKNNVPIIPGSLEFIKDIDEAIVIANKIGFPVILKASAGGGGKGMRKVNSEEEIEDSLSATKREALKSFSNDEIYIEKYIEDPKHIEVQVLGDKLGNYVHLFERDCSIQRRHQKIIEEAPSTSLDNNLRTKVVTAAIDAAKACNYYNAGTIEFLMDKNKNFYFLEMNTRLQVEHPITEQITGIDIVKEQIKIADGQKLSFSQDDIYEHGHAIECRIYAENPNNNFLPSTGIIKELEVPNGLGVRLDSGVSRNSEVTIFYDPMIAKLITSGKTREDAINKMKNSLNEIIIGGVDTNINFLKNILNSKEFETGNYDINFLEKNIEEMIKIDYKEDEIMAVLILSAVIKGNKKNNKEIDHNAKLTDSNWRRQLYE